MHNNYINIYILYNRINNIYIIELLSKKKSMNELLYIWLLFILDWSILLLILWLILLIRKYLDRLLARL